MRDGTVGEQGVGENMFTVRTLWKGTEPMSPTCGSETEWAEGWAAQHPKWEVSRCPCLEHRRLAYSALPSAQGSFV